MAKVLIVDDAYFMRNLIKKALREAGYEVIGEAKNGNEGIELYRTLKPDLVTMDINMPDMSGIDVTRQILSEDPTAKIIVISKNNDEAIKQEILEAGAKEYLKKPFQPAFLLTKVEKMLQEEPDRATLEETSSSVVKTTTKEDVISEEVIDDFFGEIEVELLDKPDETKQTIVVIENEEDVIEFPDHYPLEEEAEKHALTKENLIELIQEEEKEIELVSVEDVEIDLHVSPLSTNDSFPHSPSTPQPLSSLHKESDKNNQSSHGHKITSKERLLKQDEEPSTQPPSPSFQEREEITSPIRIRPPRGQAFQMNSDEEDEDEEEMEDFIIHASSDNPNTTPQKPKQGFFGFIKKLFKP